MEITQLSQLDMSKTYSYADYMQWKIDSLMELIRGKIFPMAAPLSQHQSVSSNLHFLMTKKVWRTSCKVFAAPFDVRLYDSKKSAVADKEIFTVIKPDICIICDAGKIDRRGCNGAPDMVIEILSASTADKDMGLKYDLYQEDGIKEYWIVHPGEEMVQVFDLDESTQRYTKRGIYSQDTEAEVLVKTIGLVLKMEDIFYN
jgi:Uma2 family endonuclease